MPTSPRQSPIRLLHLSDLHFSEKRSWDQDPVLAGLVGDIRQLRHQLGELHLVVVTGDIADKGLALEFDKAAAWLKGPVCAAAGLHATRVRVVPGNHDVDRSAIDWTVSTMDAGLIAHGDEALAQVLGSPGRRALVLDRLQNWTAFARVFHPHLDLPWWRAEEEFAGWKVRLYGLNTAWLCGSHKDAHGQVDDHRHLALGGPQWSALYTDDQEPADLEIALMHHPWEDLAPWDRKAREEATLHRCGVVLRGHLHDAGVLSGERPGRVVLEAAAGACYDKPEPGWPYGYQILELDPGRGEARIHLRKWHERTRRWIADTERYPGATPEGVATLPLRKSPGSHKSPSRAPKAAADDDAAPVSTDPLVRWRERVRELHHNPLRYVERLGLTATDLVPVDLDVETGSPVEGLEPGRRMGEAPERSGKLRALIEEDLVAERSPRWLVKAEPGAGKTTLLRQLAHVLAGTDWVPLFVSLADWELRKGSLLAAAVAQALPDDDAADTVRALGRLGREPGRLWLFLDGYDEVKNHEAVRLQVQALARDAAFAGAVIVVTSRAGAVERGRAWDGYTSAILRYLRPDQQQDLVLRLLNQDAASAAAFQRDLRDRPGVEALLRNPFLLTLAVGLHAHADALGEAAPVDRLSLLGRAIDHCLVRGWGARETDPERAERWDPRGARHALRALSLELHLSGGESWSETRLSDHLSHLRGRYPSVAAVCGPEGSSWKSTTALLSDLKHHAGLLGPLDGPGLPWRYLHRSLREMLTAEALANELAPAAREAIIQRLLSEQTADPKANATETGPGRSAEVLALLVGLLMEPDADEGRPTVDSAEPLRHLRALVGASPDAALRALAGVERLDAWEHFQLLLEIPATKDHPSRQAGWDNDQLDGVLDAIARGRGVERLWAGVGPALSVFHKSVLWYALERVETWGRAERSWTVEERAAATRRFLQASGLQDRPRPMPEVIAVRGGTFWMGSALGVGYDKERPRRQVNVSPFGLGRTPVTVAQYRAFDPAAKGQDTHPATHVDWFSARLYATWLGGRLPTEAEWEYACRAGTSTSWSCGDDPKELLDYAWFDQNSGRELHPVAQKKPNAWGLYDLHGNVWEWCEDRFGPYSAAEAGNPAGPPRGGLRVLRGGSCLAADYSRSAYRYCVGPSNSHTHFGLRLVLPVAASEP